MNIWILNHYAVPQQYYYMARSSNFAKELIKRGHKITIFAASSVHNSDINLITDGSLYREMNEDGINYVLFYGRQYEGTGKDRVINHIDVAWKMARHCAKFTEKYGKPDVIYASAGQSLTLVAGIKLAKKLGIKCISEVTDLWPESFVAFGLISEKNPLLKLLYAGERWIYKKSDAVIFSMEGGADYIIEKGWDAEHGGPIDMTKIFHINNGVVLEEFDHNKENYSIDDNDLNNTDIFKVVYAGSIRRANNVGLLIDLAKEMPKQNVKFLVWGAGDDLEDLKQRVDKEDVSNVVFKGRVEKKYIPYITSKADLTVLNYQDAKGVFKYGGSQNKLFEYFASGTPVMYNIKMGYDLIEKYNCGFYVDYSDVDGVSEQLKKFVELPKEEYEVYCTNARKAAEDYDFKKLTDKLLAILEK